jgi:hypothetical protein
MYIYDGLHERHSDRTDRQAYFVFSQPWSYFQRAKTFFVARLEIRETAGVAL